MTDNNPNPKKSTTSLYDDFPEQVTYLRKRGHSDAEIQEIIKIFRVSKNPIRKTISCKWSQGHRVDLTISFSWLNIDDFLGAIERVTKLESPEEKAQMIKRIFIDQSGKEMTVGEIVKTLENEQKKKKANSADRERLKALNELLFIYFRHAYDPHPIFLWRAYTLCRQIQLPIPPELLRYLDGVADRIEEILGQKVNTTHPYKYAITGEIPKRGKPDPQQGAIKYLRRWKAYFHPSDDHYYKGNEGDTYSDRTIQRDAEEMREFAESKLSQMLRRPNQFLL